MAVVRTSYMRALRAALGEAFDGAKHLSTDSALLRRFGLPTVEDHVAAVRMKGFAKIAVSASEALRTLLTASTSIPGSYGGSVSENLAVLHQYSKVYVLAAVRG